MLKEITYFIVTYASLVLLAPVSIAYIHRKSLHKEIRIIIFYLFLAIFFELLTYVSSHFFHYNNLFLVHLYTVLEYNLISWFYLTYFGTFVNPRIIQYLAVAFTLFAFINAFFIQTINDFNTYPRGLESILVVGLVIFAYYKMLQDLEYTRLDESPIFWINTGFLFYFSGSLFLFLLGNLLLSKDRELSMLAWAIHSCLMAFMYIFIAIGLWHTPRR